MSNALSPVSPEDIILSLLRPPLFDVALYLSGRRNPDSRIFEKLRLIFYTDQDFYCLSLPHARATEAKIFCGRPKQDKCLLFVSLFDQTESTRSYASLYCKPGSLTELPRTPLLRRDFPANPYFIYMAGATPCLYSLPTGQSLFLPLSGKAPVCLSNIKNVDMLSVSGEDFIIAERYLYGEGAPLWLTTFYKPNAEGELELWGEKLILASSTPPTV